MNEERTPALALGIVGNLNLDLWISPVTRFPRADEEILAKSARLELAGSAGYIMQGALGLGVEPRVVSTIGDDVFGDVTIRELIRLGAPTDGVSILQERETSLGTIFVAPDGSRSILSTLGAHEDMTPEIALAHDAFVAACPDVLLCGAYLLPRFGPDALVPYAAHLRRRGQIVAFDPSWDPADWPETTRAGTGRLLSEIDVYLPNEPELLALTGEADLRAAAAWAIARGAGEVVIKRGGAGAVYASGGEWIEAPGLTVQAVNTIGAGDIFDAGYLFSRRRGDAPRDRLLFANALAGLVISQTGARRYPDVREVDAAVTSLRAGGEPGGRR